MGSVASWTDIAGTDERRNILGRDDSVYSRFIRDTYLVLHPNTIRIVIGIVYHAAENYFVFLNGGITSAENFWLMTAATVAIALILILMYGPNMQGELVREPTRIGIG